MSKRIKSGLKRVLTLTLSAAIVIAVGAYVTYAWNSVDQHKTNELSGAAQKYDVTLNERFESVGDWHVGEVVAKEVSVSNPLSGGDGANPVYVRLTLKEYLEISEQSYTFTVDRYATDPTTGRFHVLPDSAAQGEIDAWLESLGYPGHDVELLTDALNDETGYFIKTAPGDINGQYGKFVVISLGSSSPESIIPGVNRSSYAETIDHLYDPANLKYECAYTPHNFNPLDIDPTEAIHAYIQWNTSDAPVALSEWLVHDQQTDTWLYDDITPNQVAHYVYWSSPLAPGITTSNILDSIELIKQPGGSFYYAIHIDMEAVSLDEMESRWTSDAMKTANLNIPNELYDFYTGFYPAPPID